MFRVLTQHKMLKLVKSELNGICAAQTFTYKLLKLSVTREVTTRVHILRIDIIFYYLLEISLKIAIKDTNILNKEGNLYCM